jgi:hypothetical protein
LDVIRGGKSEAVWIPGVKKVPCVKKYPYIVPFASEKRMKSTGTAVEIVPFGKNCTAMPEGVQATQESSCDARRSTSAVMKLDVVN